MYFNYFPDIIYDVNGNGQFEICKNILRRVAVREKVRTNTLLYDTYDVKEGESPESLAHRLYGSTDYHWVVLMVNDMTDRYHDWPMSTPQFLDFVNEKYTNPDDTHHYEISQSSGDTSVKIDIGTDNSDYPSASVVTNYGFEQERQDKIRQIKLLDPAYLNQFVTEFEELMKESIL